MEENANREFTMITNVPVPTGLPAGTAKSIKVSFPIFLLPHANY